jgi:hypothetical protein
LGASRINTTLPNVPVPATKVKVKV